MKRVGKVILALNRPTLPRIGEATMDVDDEITISENLISDSQSSLAGLGIFEDSQPSFESLGSQSPVIPDVVSTPQSSHNEHSYSQYSYTADNEKDPIEQQLQQEHGGSATECSTTAEDRVQDKQQLHQQQQSSTTP